MVLGVKGYERSIHQFIEASQALSFEDVCKDFLAFLPIGSARVLDVGSGAGQNSAALAKLGYSVVAVEPMLEFLEAARRKYGDLTATLRRPYGDLTASWRQGSLPALDCLGAHEEPFDFILVSAVWHHLDDADRAQAIERLVFLLKKGGKCALSLRNGPAGMGTFVHPTNVHHTIKQFKESGLECVLCLQNQASVMRHKDNVTWSRIVLEKL